MLVRQALANMEVVGDKSGEENMHADVMGNVTSYGTKGATTSMV